MISFRSALEWCLYPLDQVPDKIESRSESVDRVQVELLPFLLLPPLFLIATGCHVS